MSGAVEFAGTQSEITEGAAIVYFSNKVTVKDLEENTQYYYQVFKNGEWSDACEYSTKSFDNYSILYVRDPQIGACKGQTSTEGDEMADEIAARNDAFNWNRTLENALSAHPDVSFMVSAGDQVNAAEREYEYAGYLLHYNTSRRPEGRSILYRHANDWERHSLGSLKEYLGVHK